MKKSMMMPRLELCKTMEYIKGFTFGFCAPKGAFKKEETKLSLKLLTERTAINHVIFALAALQDTPQSIDVDYTGKHMVDDDELIEMIEYANNLGLKVIIKPLVNVRNGTWRAHINFFDVDVPCEPKWHQWFESYTKYQVHYAKIGQATGCHMLVVGCEMVQAARRADEWRSLIKAVRKYYKGLITYNADKYQENRVTWWDAVDVISSSGYYPMETLDEEFTRIGHLVDQYNKPFFFAEAGCRSVSGASLIPNDWELQGNVDEGIQAKYYEEMFRVSSNHSFIEGFGLWDWPYKLYSEIEAHNNDDYCVFGKAAESVVRQFYKS